MLKDFLSEKLPRVSCHLASHDVDVSLITFDWFLVVFVESLPSDILLPLWDAFLYEGTKVNAHSHTGSEAWAGKAACPRPDWAEPPGPSPLRLLLR